MDQSITSPLVIAIPWDTVMAFLQFSMVLLVALIAIVVLEIVLNWSEQRKVDRIIKGRLVIGF